MTSSARSRNVSGTVSRTRTPVALRHRVVQRLEVLDVHRRHHVDAGIENLEHVLIPLGIAAAGDVRVRQLVDHARLGLALDDRVDVHLFEHHAPVLDLASRNDLEIPDLCLRVAAAVGLHDADDDVEAARAERMRLLQHLVGLADPWRSADIDSQARPLLVLEPGQQRVSGGTFLGHARPAIF